MGFGPSELDTMERFRHLMFAGTEYDVRLTVLADRNELGGPLFGESRVWASATPFLASRFPKRRGRKRDPAELLVPGQEPSFIAAVLEEELVRLRQCQPRLAKTRGIEPLCNDQGFRCTGSRGICPAQFQRFRHKPDDDGGQRLFGTFRLVFEESVKGPISLGHSCHFGMGLFVVEV
jgi:CRISPR-associated protein Csb2